MDTTGYIHRARIGRSGKQVHACRKVVTGSRTIAGRSVEVYFMAPACTIVNSHNVNQHPSWSFSEFSDDTPITCSKCRALLGGQS